MALLGAATLATAGAVAGRLAGGETPALDVAQHAVATGDGFEISATRAYFSGTQTMVELTVTVQDDRIHAGSVHIGGSDFANNSIQPLNSAAGVTLQTGTATILRLRPLREGQAPLLEFVALSIPDANGALVRMQADWKLNLNLGGEPGDLLWTESLAPGSPVADNGVTVRPVSAVRSRTETLVTVELDGPEGIAELAFPSATIDGQVVHGARVTELSPDAGHTVTFSFPPSPRGSAFAIDIGPLIAPPQGSAGPSSYVDIYLGALLQRQGLTGRFNEKAAVGAADVRKLDPGAPDVLEVAFAQTTAGLANPNVLNLTIAGSFSDASGFTLQLPSGAIIAPPVFSRTGYPISPSGEVTTGSTIMGFVFEDFQDLVGTIRLGTGEPSTVINGNWRVDFDPMK